MSDRMKKHPLDPVDRGKGLFRTVIAGKGQTLIDAFDYLAERKTVAQVIRHPHRHLLGARIKLSPEEGRGDWYFMRIGDEVYVVAGSFAYKDPRVEVVTGDGLVQFCFNLAGDLTIATGRTERLRINRPSLMVSAQPKHIRIKEWIPAWSNERFVAIVVRPQYLIDHFLGSAVKAPALLRRLVTGSLRGLEYFQLPLHSKLFQIATKFFCGYGGLTRLVYAEAITMELLCSALESLETLSTQSACQHSDRELRCLHAARSFLTQQLSPAPTLRQVARCVGINETTLKRGFKSVYGETPFEFSVRSRMEHALTLLQDREIQVLSVAKAVGYRHQASFATAFRRHFGLRPREVRLGASAVLPDLQKCIA
jgi:AraC-like DNA-binding protein